ncbi:MAG: sodium-dependent bicarbonate transport family permease [Pseudomonadota bacterium]
MDTALPLALSTLVSPMTIFFALGVAFAAAARGVALPPFLARTLAVLMLFAIGVKGGASLAEHGLDGAVLTTILSGALLSIALTLIAFVALDRATILGRQDAAAVAAHYGSISIVTFATMTMLLKAEGVGYDGWMVAVAATMEVPAILTALILARLAVPAATPALAPAVALTAGGAATGPGAFSGAAAGMREACAGIFQARPILLLVGAFALGWIAGEMGADWQENVAYGFFPMVLCLFLLDLGLMVGRRLGRLFRRFDPRLALFAVLMPLAGAMLGLMTGQALGLGVGNTALLAALAASASYLAAPATLRVALPEARPELYLTLSLCLTLPFNLILGLPLYLFLASMFAG